MDMSRDFQRLDGGGDRAAVRFAKDSFGGGGGIAAAW